MTRDELYDANQFVVATLAYARGILKEGGRPRTASSWYFHDLWVELRYVYLEGRVLVHDNGRTRTLTVRGHHPQEELAAVRLALTRPQQCGRLAV